MKQKHIGLVGWSQHADRPDHLIVEVSGRNAYCRVSRPLRATIMGLAERLKALPAESPKPAIQVWVWYENKTAEFVITELAYDPFAPVESE